MTDTEQKQVVVVSPTKSMGVAIILTFLFGPLGMFYSTVSGAFILLLIALVVGVVTGGIGLLLIWPISIIWGAMATSSYNKKLIAGAQQY